MLMIIIHCLTYIQVLLYQYDGRTSECDQFEWSTNAIDISKFMHLSASEEDCSEAILHDKKFQVLGQTLSLFKILAGIRSMLYYSSFVFCSTEFIFDVATSAMALAP
ncbi:uncharacterized protein [Cicer arietinum]|uniref:Uncharacterized protein LOC101493605 isoform X1 n=1 Tax=Cicer arietinum TaxID=3827 RepID=A0A1S2Z1D8_CICAR|nr:uncharacterized protein LOC101493605 isoform X1 [Cicer arietinum]XP_027193533.1 uncharacterized protein LOC101493605 isoform X1 [Cicer arietinum]XP_027193534.1 uncharacterized protein LOC101493605 isoform X1 [Cicer arietinum]XP_027193535.1 uncharacterized protein LOC101493605 isoform X1 [Cicer arietinum]